MSHVCISLLLIVQAIIEDLEVLKCFIPEFVLQSGKVTNNMSFSHLT